MAIISCKNVCKMSKTNMFKKELQTFLYCTQLYYRFHHTQFEIKRKILTYLNWWMKHAKTVIFKINTLMFWYWSLKKWITQIFQSSWEPVLIQWIVIGFKAILKNYLFFRKSSSGFVSASRLSLPTVHSYTNQLVQNQVWVFSFLCMNLIKRTSCVFQFPIFA